MNRKNPKVDGLLRRGTKWREESEEHCRAVILDSELTKGVKWYQPCYTLQDGRT